MHGAGERGQPGAGRADQRGHPVHQAELGPMSLALTSRSTPPMPSLAAIPKRTDRVLAPDSW